MAHLKKFEHLRIPLEAIKLATNNFSDDCYIGKGGFGKVYKGEIVHSDGTSVAALKRLDRKFGQGDPEFWKEIIMLSSYKHENIVSLLGHCDECGEKILVYEYASNKSLDYYLNRSELTWVRRLKICIGAARGLSCLHSADGTQQRILHRDVKSANILLDESWNAKISDFGLSKLGPANQEITFLVTQAVGTLGYCDPLYVETGLLTKESDVYSFGVVLFEVLFGRLCFHNNNKHQSFVRLARQAYEQNTLNDIIYGNMKDEISPYSLKVFTTTAYHCLKIDREERPLMTEIVRTLESALEYQVGETDIEPVIIQERGLDLVKHGNPGILKVKVLRAMKLKTKKLFGSCNPYVELRMTGSDYRSKKTTIKDKSMNPTWYEEFNLLVKDLHFQCLAITIYNANKQEEKRHEILGTSFLTLTDLTTQESKTVTLDLEYNAEKTGQIITIEVVFKPYTPDEIPSNLEVVGNLFVNIINGRFLQGVHHTNPFVRVLFKGAVDKTKCVNNNQNPEWGQLFYYHLDDPPTNEIVHLEVISVSRMGLVYPEECLGYVDINLNDVVGDANEIVKKYNLIDSKSGELLVGIKWWMNRQV